MTLLMDKTSLGLCIAESCHCSASGKQLHTGLSLCFHYQRITRSILFVYNMYTTSFVVQSVHIWFYTNEPQRSVKKMQVES